MNRSHALKAYYRTLKLVRILAVLLIGGSLLLVGIAMLVLPGPGILVIIVGLVVLATEFIWARHMLNALKEKIARLKNKIKRH